MHKNYVKKGNRMAKNKRIRTILILLILIAGSIYLINNSKKQINRIGSVEQALGAGPIEVPSLVQGMMSKNFTDGDYTLKVNDEVYDIEVINYYEDVVYSLEGGQTTRTISLGDSTTEYKTLVVKYHGDLTIDKGVTITATKVGNYTYKKGMYIYVAGKLINNGTITMTARGTYNCAGQNVYLWKNADETYEYVPAVGATGAAARTGKGSVSTKYHGYTGSTGSNRGTGGGGSGGMIAVSKTTTSGAGGNGTSFSGGAGGGGAYNGATAGKGSSIGGPGGNGAANQIYNYGTGGGAGNIGGKGVGNGARADNGSNGTGGLLIIAAGNFQNNGIISSNGSAGGTAYRAGGGGSGGGSINIFYNTLENQGTLQATGGAGGVGTRANAKETSNGGAGGTGSASITFVEGITYKDNYILMSPGDIYTIDESQLLILGKQENNDISYKIEDTSIATLQLPLNIKAKTVGTTKLIITDNGTGNFVEVIIEVSNSVAQIPCAPTLSAGMIPIKWDGNYWTITEATDTSWYDYLSGKPAYIMLNDGVYQSELVRDMTNKKLAEKYVGYRINEEELGSIYMWIPRYAYSPESHICYVKQEYNVVGNWKIPEIFKHETESIDFSLAGVWAELKSLENSTATTTKINNINIEENAYGFIANTVGVNVPNDIDAQDTIKKFASNFNAESNPIENPENTNRTILKIYDTTKKEPIKAKVTYSGENAIVELIYFKYGINKVVNANGKELVKIATNKYELASLNDITYTYTIIDNEGNEKEVSLDGIYIIPDAATLSTFRNEVNAGNNFAGINVIQTADIDMSSVCSSATTSWIPIGATENYFAGTYNGNYNTLSNLYINSGTYANTGLFSQTVSSTIIQNLIIENFYVYNNYNQAASGTGAIAGYNSGKIENCASVGGIITGYQITTATSYKITSVGGIVGCNTTGIIESSFNNSIISGTANTSNEKCHIRVGGITGYNNGGNVECCYNAGSITGEGYYAYVGGVIGASTSDIKVYPIVSNCYNYGKVSIISSYMEALGGIIGASGTTNTNGGSTITKCYCSLDTTYSYSWYNNAWYTSTEGRVSADELKTYANIGEDGTSKLGSAYKDDTYGINNGYPVLTWQEGGFLEKQKIIANAYYDETEEKVFVDISYTKHGISKVITVNGVELTKVDTNKYELANLNDITTTYKVIDDEGNEKEFKLNGVYIIPDAQTLSIFRDEVNAGNTFVGTTVIQTADINLNEGKYTIDETTGEAVFAEDAEQWVPIGNDTVFFAGTYNGQKHTINGIYINNTASTQGLFGQINGATIKNITVKEGYIKGEASVGGISGIAVNSNIQNCENYCEVSVETTAVGGIIGVILNSDNTTTVQKSYNYGDITSGLASIGGIVGAVNNGKALLNECYNTGIVTAKETAGGILGIAITNSVVTITNSYNTGRVETTTGPYVGGLVGLANVYSNVIVDNCFNIAEITAKTYCAGGVFGGLYGNSTATTTNSYNTGNIKAITNDNAGGICGVVDSYSGIAMDSCYNVGDVSVGNAYAGGMIGLILNNSTKTITNCYYKSGQTSSYGGTATTVEQFKTLANSLGTANWRNDETDESGKWKYNNGYPILTWQANIGE